MKKIIITIDGVAASGKSTTAKKVADELGYEYLNTGFMYRAMALKLQQEKFPIERLHEEGEMVSKFLQSTNIIPKKNFVLLDGIDVTEQIRTSEISKLTSIISSNVLVRKKMIELQRNFGRQKGIVTDGRDMGTVVFPQAELKIYMSASSKERARRRFLELKKSTLSIHEIEKDLIERDRQDMCREISPLRKAPDAIEMDTSTMTIDEQVVFIKKIAIERINQ